MFSFTLVFYSIYLLQKLHVVMIWPLATVLLVASSALAAGQGAACVGPTSVATLGGAFDIVAVQTGKTTVNWKMVLAPALALSGEDFRTLATNLSYSTTEPTTFNLTNGGILGSKVRVASQGVGVNVDAPINFQVGSTDAPSDFCALLSTGMGGNGGDGSPVLSVRGNATGFNICQGENAHLKKVYQYLIYDPKPDGSHYDFYSCIPVDVHLVPSTGTGNAAPSSSSTPQTGSSWMSSWTHYAHQGFSGVFEKDGGI